MKRAGLCVGVLSGMLLFTGCDEVKRRATESARGIGTHAADQAEEKLRKKGNDAAESAVKTGEEDPDSPEAKKRNKLKGDDDTDK